MRERVLVTFDSRVRSVEFLDDAQVPPRSAMLVEWLLPGFINAHCHLEYSWLAGRLPRGDVPFGQWMQAIMGMRATDAGDLERKNNAMAEGAQDLVAGGCTTVIDSTTDGASAAHLAHAGLRHFLFHEVLGLSQERALPILENAYTRIANMVASDAGFPGHGLNPHAPYSVGPWLRGQLRSASGSKYPQGWHLAETPDEEELFRAGTGSIADTLKAFGLPLPFGEVPGCSSFEFLQREEQLENADIAFHGNELSDVEAGFFCAPRALVHCPSTHRWFQRAKVPLRKWLDAGVNVCLGTDSLASSDTLSMLEILRMVVADYPEISADEVLQMATTKPAQWEMLKEHGISGAIEEGASADFVGLDGLAVSDLQAMLAGSGIEVSNVWIDGILRFNVNGQYQAYGP